MQLGLVIGHATSTIKHEALVGWRLLVIQPLGASRQPEADCVIAISAIDAAVGQTVVLNSDGKAAREIVGHTKSPVRYFVAAVEADVPA